MAEPPTQNFQVVVPSHSQGAQNAGQGYARPFSVARALQCTPLTTSVTSACDRIPLPQIGRAKQSSRISTPFERKTLNRVIAQQPSGEVKEKLNILLNPETLAEINFKRPPLSSQGLGLCHTPAPTANRKMSPIARMVLDMTDIDYRYPSPSSPGYPKSPSPRHHSHGQSLPTPAVSQSPEIRSRNGSIFVSNATTAPSPTQGVTPKQKIVIEVPQLPSSQRKDCATASGSPKRRKLDHTNQSDGFSLHIRAQKEIADSTLQQFQDLLIELFEAQDRIDLDTKSSNSLDHEYFDRPDDADDTGLRITLPMLERLQLAIKQLVAHKRLNDISLDHLRRLQQVCELSIEATQTIRLKLQTDASEDEVNEWLRQISKAENGALSACVLLRIVQDDPQSEDLLSQDVLGWIPHVLKNLFENCLIPIVEARPLENKDATLFKCAFEAKDPLKRLLDASKKLFDLMASVCVQGKLDEAAVISIEFLAARLVLAENGPTDKVAALGTQTFEKVRKMAMGALAKIFARFSKQRSIILDELLTSLNKLPSTSRSARQYKLADGKNIQLITALMMQLVQTTTLKSAERATAVPLRITVGDSQINQGVDDTGEDDEDELLRHHMLDADDEDASPLQKLQKSAESLYGNAAKSAQDIVNHLVSKASLVSKTGEDNARNLLDFFVEDLLTVLPSPDWPAAELLLRILAARMIDRARHDKSASVKNMALEFLGGMGSTISSLRASLPNHLAMISQQASSSATDMLLRLVDNQMSGGIQANDLVSLHGPFRTTHKYLQGLHEDGLRSRSAARFQIVQWAQILCYTLRAKGIDEEQFDSETRVLIRTVLDQITEASSLPAQSESIAGADAKVAHILIVLNLSLGRRFDEMMRTLVASFSSEQAQVRSRSIKSVLSILETDSSLLDRDSSIVDDIFACGSDDSAMVRDSALALIAKFIVPRAALEEKGIKRLLECAADSKVGVQKRAIGYLKEIYIGDTRPALQAAIADALLRRLRDAEEVVSSLAMKTLTDIWITPFLSITDTASGKIQIQELAHIIVKTVAQDSDELSPLVSKLISEVVIQSKRAPEVLSLCSNVVSELFEDIITDQETSADQNKQASLLTIKIFTEANAHTIGSDQLRALRPYLGNLTKQEDLAFFRPVVAIMNCVLSSLPSTQKPFLQDVQDDLMKIVAKLRRRVELDEVMNCLWTIDGELHNTEKLVRLAASVLKPLMNGKVPDLSTMQSTDTIQQATVSAALEKQKSCVRIIGSIGKHWLFDSEIQHKNMFRSKFPDRNVKSVAAFMTSVVCPLTGPQFSLSLRALALESLGSICVRWPMEFNQPAIWTSLLTVFQGPIGEPNAQTDLQSVVLASFEELFHDAEDQQGLLKDGEEKRTDFSKMGGDDKSIAFAGVLGQVAQKFLSYILAAALAAPNKKALTATKVLASINRQGQVHPKDCLGAMVALEGSTNPDIAEVAFFSHLATHQQHASTYQPKYIEAVETAFRYQTEVIGDMRGATRTGFRPKLLRCFEVVNTSNTKYVKHYLQKLVERTTRELTKINHMQEHPEDLSLARFILHNLAFFDYQKTDELLHTVFRMEVEFGQKGAEVVHAIEILLRPAKAKTDSEAEELRSTTDTASLNNAREVDPIQLKQLATAATILTMLWDTRSFLKRLYGIGRDIRQALGDVKKDKEGTKAPQRVHGITGDRYWEKTSDLMSSSTSPEALITLCEEFSMLMSIDDEVKVAAEDDGLRDLYSASLDRDDDKSKPGNSGTGRKRKSTTSVGGTPKKKRGRPSLNQKARRGSRSSTEDLDVGFEE